MKEGMEKSDKKVPLKIVRKSVLKSPEMSG